MENLTILYGLLVILAATSAIFGAATLLLGKEIKNLRGQLWSLEAQSHLEEQKYFKAIREAQSRIYFLEREPRRCKDQKKKQPRITPSRVPTSPLT